MRHREPGGWVRHIRPMLGVAFGLAFGLSGPRSAAAQLIAPAWSFGELGFGVEERLRLGGEKPHGASDRRIRLWLKVPLRGEIGGTRRLFYQGTLRPATTYAPARDESPNLRFRQFDYDVTLRLAGIPAATMTGALARSEGTGRKGGALFTESDVRNRSAVATLAFRPMPLSGGIERRETRFTWSVSPLAPALVQDERTTQWRVAGQNSRTSLHFDRTLHDDRQRDADYVAWNANASHALRWGRGSRLQSTYRQGERDGSSPYRSSSWEERLNLRHLRRLSTEWTFARHTQASARSLTTTEAVRGTFHHEPWSFLEWSLGAGVHETLSDGIGSRTRSVMPRVTLKGGPPGGLHGRVSLDGTLEYRRSSGTSSGLRFRLAERHVFDASRAFVLDLPHVDTTSVVVRDEGSPTRYDSGVDYRIAVVGDRIELHLTPTSRIGIGQGIVIDYQYRADPPGDADLALWRSQIALDWHGWSLRHATSIRNAAADEAMLLLAARDEREVSTELAVRSSARAGTIVGHARIESRHADAFVQSGKDVGAAVTRTLRPGVDATLEGSWNRRDGTGGRVDVTSLGVRAAWTPGIRYRFGAAISTYALVRPETPGERVTELDLRGDACIAALEGRLQFRQQWLRPDGRGSMRLVTAQVVRRF